MDSRHKLPLGLTVLAAIVAATAGPLARGELLLAQGTAGQVPVFEVDPMWPKPLPGNWVIGAVVGIGVDAKDNIWMVHRDSFLTENELAPECCTTAPPVLVFDQAGNLLKTWGVGVTPWPASEHGIYIDYRGNVWLGGNGTEKGNADTQVMKFTQDGKFLLQIGKHNVTNGSNDTENLNNPTKVAVDPATNEVFIADGYLNRRVIVFDADTGKYKRHWGAYGNKPNDDDPCNNVRARVNTDYDPDKPCQNFGRGVHGIVLAKDGLLYVADRPNNRVQVFQKNGTFVKEAFVNRTGRGKGAAFDVTLSPDPAERFLYVADGAGMKVHILRRDTMEEVGTFARAGRQPGQLQLVHTLATDSKGNVYTGETNEGKRIQKFVYKGLRTIATQNQQ